MQGLFKKLICSVFKLTRVLARMCFFICIRGDKPSAFTRRFVVLAEAEVEVEAKAKA